MSDKPDAESTPPDAAETRAAGRGESTEAAPVAELGEASNRPSPARSGRGLGALALMVALAALVLAALPYGPRDDEEPGEATRVEPARIEALDDGLRRLNERIDQLTARSEPARDALRNELGQQIDAEVAALRQALDALNASMEDRPDEVAALARRVGRLEGTQSSGEASLEARMAALEQRIEQRVASLQDQLGGLGADLDAAAEERARRLALVHAQALLMQGRDEWMLGVDADAARAAWAQAEARIAGVATPPAGLVDAMVRLMRGAERLESPRISERVAALERLAASAVAWPAPDRPDASPSENGSEDRSDARDGEGTGSWRDRVAGAFGALVTVEALEDAPPTPLDIERARRRIVERLDAAALASAREDWATASRLIEAAVETVRAELDPDAPMIREALERLEELVQPPASPVLPAAYEEVMDSLVAALERGE